MPEYKVTVDGKTYTVDIGRVTEDTVDVSMDGKDFQVQVEVPDRKQVSKTPVIARRREAMNVAEVPNRTSPPGTVSGSGEVLAPLPGLIMKLLVATGDAVTEGQPVAIMEAMKMENEIEAPISGKVGSITVSEGETVLENAIIMRIEG